MTLLEGIVDRTRPEHVVPVLETERLTLRAPRHGDVKAIAALANDRRIAANTARIPHPYGVADAEQFIASVNKRDGETCFVIVLGDRLIGACGLDPQEDGPELGYWLGAPYWGQRLRDRGRACRDRSRVRRTRARDAAGRRAGQQSGVAAGAGEVRVPVDRRAAHPHPRHQFGGAGRSLSSRSRLVGVAQSVGSGASGGVSYWPPAVGAAKNGASLATSAGPKWPCGFDGVA